MFNYVFTYVVGRPAGVTVLFNIFCVCVCDLLTLLYPSGHPVAFVSGEFSTRRGALSNGEHNDDVYVNIARGDLTPQRPVFNGIPSRVVTPRGLSANRKTEKGPEAHLDEDIRPEQSSSRSATVCVGESGRRRQ